MVADEADPFAAVIGQEAAVRGLRAAASAPVHAYLLVGPKGAGARLAARAFAAEVLAAGLEGAERDRVVHLAMEGSHVDLVEIEPDGNVWRFPREGDSPGLRLVREASTSPREAGRKVVVAVDFHLARDEAIGKLLKVIEEPPPTTVLVLLEDEVPPEQVTIASRCARIDLGPVPTAVVVDHLVGQGIDADRARMLAESAQGDVERAVRLASDPGVAERAGAWRAVPSRLDGRGATVVALTRELVGLLDDAGRAVQAAHEAERERLREQAEARGTERGLGLAQVTERQKREVRQLRTAELRVGLATLAGPYRDALARVERAGPLVRSLGAIQAAAAALERNPVEDLLLEHLLLELEPLGS